MRKLICTWGIILLLATTVTLSAESEGNLETNLSLLPEIVLESAKSVKQNIEVTGFRMEFEGKKFTYEVEGFTEDTCYEIEVTTEGKILEVEECD